MCRLVFLTGRLWLSALVLDLSDLLRTLGWSLRWPPVWPALSHVQSREAECHSSIPHTQTSSHPTTVWRAEVVCLTPGDKHPESGSLYLLIVISGPQPGSSPGSRNISAAGQPREAAEPELRLISRPTPRSARTTRGSLSSCGPRPTSPRRPGAV